MDQVKNKLYLRINRKGLILEYCCFVVGVSAYYSSFTSNRWYSYTTLEPYNETKFSNFSQLSYTVGLLSWCSTQFCTTWGWNPTLDIIPEAFVSRVFMIIAFCIIVYCLKTKFCLMFFNETPAVKKIVLIGLLEITAGFCVWMAAILFPFIQVLSLVDYGSYDSGLNKAWISGAGFIASGTLSYIDAESFISDSFEQASSNDPDHCFDSHEKELQ